MGRLKGYDYTDAGYYFITAVTGNRVRFFGGIESGVMNLSCAGIIAREEMITTGDLREYVIIDEFIIMPDHVHMILVIRPDPRSLVAHPRSLVAHPRSLVARYEATGMGSEYFSSISPRPESVSAIVRGYKSAVTRRCHLSGIADFSWQRGFYDRIIRDQNELDALRKYIRQNPGRWGQKHLMDTRPM